MNIDKLDRQEPSLSDEEDIWLYVYEKMFKSAAVPEPISPEFFKEFIAQHDVKYTAAKLHESFTEFMIPTLYKAPKLETTQILELYKALKIPISEEKEFLIEKFHNVLIHINYQTRCLVSYDFRANVVVPSQKSVEPKRLSLESNDDVIVKKRSKMIEKTPEYWHIGSDSHDSDVPANDSTPKNVIDTGDSAVNTEAQIEVKSEPPSVDSESEDVSLAKEVSQSNEEEDDGDVTISKVVGEVAEIPDDTKKLMWSYLEANFEKDRPQRVKNVKFWEIFIIEKKLDSEILASQFARFFVREMLPELWNRPIPIARRLEMLHFIGHPITEKQKKKLEEESQMRIHLDEMKRIMNFAPPGSYRRPINRRKGRPSTVPMDLSFNGFDSMEVLGEPRPAEEDYKLECLKKKPVSRGQRVPYSSVEHLCMWRFLLAEMARENCPRPKGYEFWKKFQTETGCWRPVKNLNSHFRKHMNNGPIDMPLPLLSKLLIYEAHKLKCPEDMLCVFRTCLKCSIKTKSKGIIVSVEKKKEDDSMSDDESEGDDDDDDDDEDEEDSDEEEAEDSEEGSQDHDTSDDSSVDLENEKTGQLRRSCRRMAHDPEVSILKPSTSIRRSTRITHQPRRFTESTKSSETTLDKAENGLLAVIKAAIEFEESADMVCDDISNAVKKVLEMDECENAEKATDDLNATICTIIIENLVSGDLQRQIVSEIVETLVKYCPGDATAYADSIEMISKELSKKQKKTDD